MTDPRPVGDMRAVLASLNCCRTTVYKLMREDPEFPAPFTMPPVDKLTWFLDEVEDYKATRPRRIYAAVVAVLAVVGVTALSYANFFLA